MGVHVTAIVEDGATLGPEVDVGPFCIVGRHCVLGEGVRLLSHVVVSGRTQIGARTVVHPQAVLGGEGQIRNNDFDDARLIIGSDCVIREGVTMSGGSRGGRGVTRIGNNGYFMSYSHIGHDCVVEDDVNFANNATLAGHVQIGQGVIFGGLSAVQQFGRVGRGAMIGGVTGVNTDVIPYGMAIGDHAVLGGLNIIGLKRRGISREAIHAIRAAFRAIFLETKGTLLDRARKAKVAWPEVAQIQEIVDFILADAKRGLCVPDPSRRHADSE
jgi:UDP-N-acetylglucosamine acyltransferase